MNNQRIVVSVNLKRTIKIMKLTVLMLTVACRKWSPQLMRKQQTKCFRQRGDIRKMC